MKNLYKQINMGRFATAKHQAKSCGLLAVIIAIAMITVIGFSFTACGGGHDDDDNGGGAQTVTYTGTANGLTYTLLITKDAARYAAQVGDKYELTNDHNKSTGTVIDVSGNTLTLKPSNATETFTATVSGEGLIGLNGFVTWNDRNDGQNLEEIFDSVTLTPVPTSGGPTNWIAVTNNTIWEYTKSNGSTEKVDINGIAYGSGRFIAVGDEGKMAYSSDGESWTAVTTDNNPFVTVIADNITGTDIYSIAYVGGNFFAWDVLRRRYSKDGENWAAVSITYIGAIAYGNGRFVAGGNKGKIAYSSNCTNWTDVADSTVWEYPSINISTREPITATADILSIAYGNNRFVAVGDGATMAYSSDGESWTAITNNPFKTNRVKDASMQAIAYGGGKFVAVNVDGQVAYSADGINWTAANKTAPAGSIVYGNGRFVAVGRSGKVAYSADGVSWTAVSNSTFGTSRINGIAYSNGRFAAVGDEGKMAYADWGEHYEGIGGSYGGGGWGGPVPVRPGSAMEQ